MRGGGSGVILRSDGYILTNNHVVHNASRIEVRLRSGKSFPAKLVGADSATDLAMLKIDARALPQAEFASSEKARVGQFVIAIGSPFGLDYTVTTGVLSAKGRGGIGANEIEDYLQTDASINPGNSGGPLVNLHGRVLGINTMIIGRVLGVEFLERLDRGMIGVQLEDPLAGRQLVAASHLLHDPLELGRDSVLAGHQDRGAGP